MAYRSKPEPPRLPPASPHHDPPPQLHRHEVQLTIVLPPGSGLDFTTKLDAILAHLRAISLQENTIMATVTSIKQLVTDLDAETNDVAAKVDAQTAEIQRLSDLLASGGAVTQADLDAIGAGLEPISARLKALGASQTDPIPEPTA